jgi:hypothetical protein
MIIITIEPLLEPGVSICHLIIIINFEVSQKQSNLRNFSNKFGMDTELVFLLSRMVLEIMVMRKLGSRNLHRHQENEIKEIYKFEYFQTNKPLEGFST